MRPSRHGTRRTAFSISAHTIDLPLEEKIAYGGAVVSLIATLLPWFSFTTEQSYNGLQNVTWLIGYSIMFLSILVLVPWTCGVSNLKTPSVLMRQTWHWGITGGMVLLLSCIALSVYASFQWISIRSTIHFGLYGTLLGGVAVLSAAVLNKARSHRRGHVAHINPPSSLEDEEIERHLRRSPSAEDDGRQTSPRTPRPSVPQDIPTERSPRDERQGPPAMFDV